MFLESDTNIIINAMKTGILYLNLGPEEKMSKELIFFNYKINISFSKDISLLYSYTEETMSAELNL